MRLFYLFILLAGLLSSCATSSLIWPGFQPAAVPAMPYAPPVAQIGLSQVMNFSVLNEDASDASTLLMHNLLFNRREELHLLNELAIPARQQARAQQQIYRAIDAIDKRRNLSSATALTVLDTLLDKQPHRYLFITATRGFTRLEGNYGNQMMIGVGISVLTAGAFAPVPQKARSVIYALIYDREQKHIVYFTHTAPHANGEPLDELVVEKQLRKLLAKDFPYVTR